MNTLPDGYVARPTQIEDAEAVLATLLAYSRALIGIEEDTLDGLKLYWQSPGFDLRTDSLVILASDGQVAGYTEFWERGAPYVRQLAWSCVHPGHWERGLGKYLLEWSVERGRRNVWKAPEGTQVVLQHFIAHSNQAAARLFTASGFQYVRSNYVMRVDFDRPPELPNLPDGITIRPINGTEELRPALLTVHQAFLDHWGNTNPPFEEYYQQYKQRTASDPHFDPSLWFIALDGSPRGNEIAGVSACSLHADEDPDMAWVGTLGVLRPWRKRGVGLALLLHSFNEFYRRGKKSAGLVVDASSLTGAVRLYERAGMHVDRQMDIYELELRPGKDIMKRSIEEASKVEEK